MTPSEIAAALLNRVSELTPWEHEFVHGFRTEPIVTDKQRAKLLEIWQRVSRAGDEADPSAATGWRCQDCGGATHHWQGAIVADGRPLCPSCRWARIERDARNTRCTEPGCTKTASEHVREFREIVTAASWQDRFTSRRGEPRGELATDRP